ncbi:hypothetical protein AC579_4290 [Pseudocercospora musae]|uniref:Uncharacterized protein n=1 Tax=Pseudocercospora musae TaxID=113226 RepID=A0A139IAU4_9PEZI|nr:hypothetical protein AC579_4290 [Pseudocercospora musae]
MSARTTAPIAKAPATKPSTSTTNTVTPPSPSQPKETTTLVRASDRFGVRHNTSWTKEERPWPIADRLRKPRIASLTGGKSFRSWLRDMLEDDDVDDDEVVLDMTSTGGVALQAHQHLPMVHQDYLVFGPRTSRDKQYITTVPATSPRIDEDDAVYKYGGTAVRTNNELNGRITDVMVCSKDICQNERCYTPPGREDPVKPDHTPMPFESMPFVHTKRDCVVRDGVTYFEGVLDIPNSSWSSLPPQVEKVDVMFVVDGEEVKSVSDLSEARCVARERLVAIGETAGEDKKPAVTGRRNAGRAAKKKA